MSLEYHDGHVGHGQTHHDTHEYDYEPYGDHHFDQHDEHTGHAHHPDEHDPHGNGLSGHEPKDNQTKISSVWPHHYKTGQDLQDLLQKLSEADHIDPETHEHLTTVGAQISELHEEYAFHHDDPDADDGEIQHGEMHRLSHELRALLQHFLSMCPDNDGARNMLRDFKSASHGEFPGHEGWAPEDHLKRRRKWTNPMFHDDVDTDDEDHYEEGGGNHEGLEALAEGFRDGLGLNGHHDGEGEHDQYGGGHEHHAHYHDEHDHQHGEHGEGYAGYGEHDHTNPYGHDGAHDDHNGYHEHNGYHDQSYGGEGGHGYEHEHEHGGYHDHE